MDEKQQEFQEEMMTENAVTFPDFLERVDPVDTDMERYRAGAKILERWEPLIGQGHS